MKFLSARKKENALPAQSTASSSRAIAAPPRPRTPNAAPARHGHYLDIPRGALEPLTPEGSGIVRSKASSKSRSTHASAPRAAALVTRSAGDASPSRGPYPFSRAFFSQSTPSIPRPAALNEPPPVPTLPGKSNPQQHQQQTPPRSSPGFFGALKGRRQRADSSHAPAQPATKPELLAVPEPHPRTLSFGAYLMGASAGSGSGKKRDHVPTRTQAPELPPLSPMSAFHLFDDGGKLYGAHPPGTPVLVPRTPKKKHTRAPSRPPPLAPPAPVDHYRPQTQRSCSEPVVSLTPKKAHLTPSRRSPVPVLDGVWQGFLAEIEEDATVLNLYGAVKASLDLDWPRSSPAARPSPSRYLRPCTPTRSTSESALPYLLRTPTPGPDSPQRTPVRPSPATRRATEGDLEREREELISRTASNFSLSLFPLPPARGEFIPSRPAPRPPGRPRTLALPSHREREEHATPPLPHFPPPSPTTEDSDANCSTSTTSSSGPWDDLFDGESTRTGRCSSRATSVSHARSDRDRPTTCDFFSAGAEVKWGYAV